MGAAAHGCAQARFRPQPAWVIPSGDEQHCGGIGANAEQAGRPGARAATSGTISWSRRGRSTGRPPAVCGRLKHVT
jgi:hypothetical protein